MPADSPSRRQDQILSGTGGQILARVLEIHGVQRIYTVPGESFLDVLDALHDSPIQVVTCRQEGGAAMAAEAEGKLTGRPGIAFVTRGPGTTNASAGLHVALQDSSPMILFIGQIERGHREREAFQEVDYRQMLGPLTKWVAEIDEAARIPELVTRAFQTATSGRPGPVALALPEDMLAELAETVRIRPWRPVRPAPPAEAIADAVNFLRSAERPLVLIGGRAWSAEDRAMMQAKIESWDLPVATGFRHGDAFDQSHPNYAGDAGLGINPDLAESIRQADLILAVGLRLGDATTSGYTLLQPPKPAQRLIHVHPGPEELGRVYQADLAILSDAQGFFRALPPKPDGWQPRWLFWRQELRRQYEAFIQPKPTPGAVDVAALMLALRQSLPPEAILTNGAGNFAAWVHRHMTLTRPGTQLAPTSGSMGYGLPAAIGAAFCRPDRPVVAFAGDGDLQMTVQELATIAAHRLRILVVCMDNQMYGTIRMHQERRFPGRVEATHLQNPEFAALAKAYGLGAWTIAETAEIQPALAEALAHPGPGLIWVKVDPQALTPNQTLDQARAQGEAARQARAEAARRAKAAAGPVFSDPVSEPAGAERDPAESPKPAEPPGRRILGKHPFRLLGRGRKD